MDSSLNRKAGKAGVWYTVGNMLLKGFVFLSLPIFTRLLSASDFGRYNTYIAYEQIIVAILGLGMYGTVKNALLDFSEDFEGYISSVISVLCLALAIGFIIINLVISIKGSFLGYGIWIANCLLFQSFGLAVLNLYGIKLNAQFRYKPYLMFALINNVGNILISILLIKYVFVHERYLGRIIGSGLPLLLLGAFLTGYSLIKGRKPFKRAYCRYALLLGIPLVPHVLSQSLLNQFDRIMIHDLVGASEAGIYSFIYTMSTILYVVENSFEHAWSPWVYLKLKDGRAAEVKKASRDYMKGYFLLTIGFMCVSPEVARLFSISEYWSGITLIFPLSLSMLCIFMYSLPASIEYYHKKTGLISYGTVIAAGMNVLLNYICINRFGYMAAAYTTVASYMLLFAFHWLFSRKLGVDAVYDLKGIIRYFLLALMILIIFSVTYQCYYVGLTIRALVCAGVMIMLMQYRDILLRAFKRG